MQKILNGGKRWVIKIGTSTLTTKEAQFSYQELDQVVGQVVNLLRRKADVILVSSGAIALGMETLALLRRPQLLSELQACAAIGQGKLMKAYEASFSKHGFH